MINQFNERKRSAERKAAVELEIIKQEEKRQKVAKLKKDET